MKASETSQLAAFSPLMPTCFANGRRSAKIVRANIVQDGDIAGISPPAASLCRAW
jgi:hypothetical protein